MCVYVCVNVCVPSVIYISMYMYYLAVELAIGILFTLIRSMCGCRENAHTRQEGSHGCLSLTDHDGCLPVGSGDKRYSLLLVWGELGVSSCQLKLLAKVNVQGSVVGLLHTGQ